MESIAELREVRSSEVPKLAAFVSAAGVSDAGSLVDDLQRERGNGYRLYAAYLDQVPIVIAGTRETWSFTYGRHILICDLVSIPGPQTSDLIHQLLAWVARKAKSLGMACIYLQCFGRLREQSKHQQEKAVEQPREGRWL